MNYTVTAAELNFHYVSHKFKEIKTAQDLFKKIKQMHIDFDSSRDTRPVNIQNIYDDDGLEIKIDKPKDQKPFLIPEKSELVYGHYFIYSDAGYSFNSNKKIKDIYADIKNFNGNYDYENIYLDKKKKDAVELEMQDTGSSSEEQTFFYWLDSKGKLNSEAFDITILDSDGKYDKDQKKLVESHAEKIFSSLSK
jgi:hypothetical protein